MRFTLKVWLFTGIISPFFIALVLGTTYIHFNLMPKSTYMLDHINNGEQAKAWLSIYKEMKFRCQLGMILGVLSLPFICNIFV